MAYTVMQQVRGKSRVHRLTEDVCIEFFMRHFGADIKITHMREYSKGVGHACANTGPMELPYNSVMIMNRTVCYAFCQYCKKLWYYVPEVL